MSYIGNSPYQVAFVSDLFNGTGSLTTFSMAVAPANPASVLVVVSGVVQSPDTYSVSGTTLTFSAAPPYGVGNISVRYLGIPASGVTTTAYRTITEFTATAGQTTFTPPSYTVGFITVFRNGVRLGSADYTATNGTTVVLGSGATVGDLVTIESYYVSSYLNAIPNTPGSVQQTNIATGVAGTGPAFAAYLTSDQSVTLNTVTKATLDTEEFDFIKNKEFYYFLQEEANQIFHFDDMGHVNEDDEWIEGLKLDFSVSFRINKDLKEEFTNYIKETYE